MQIRFNINARALISLVIFNHTRTGITDTQRMLSISTPTRGMCFGSEKPEILRRKVMVSHPDK